MSQPAATRVVEDYVTLIWKAQEHSSKGITSTEISKKLEVAKSTVSETLRRLANDGWIDYAPYRAITLTQRGRELAESVVRRHRLIETVLVEKLGYGWDEVHEEADLLEHAVSDKLLARIDALLGYPQADPHGDPIPPFHKEDLALVRIDRVASGQTVRIERVSDENPEILRYLAEHGLGPGVLLSELDYLPEHKVLSFVHQNQKVELSGVVCPYLFVTVLAQHT